MRCTVRVRIGLDRQSEQLWHTLGEGFVSFGCALDAPAWAESSSLPYIYCGMGQNYGEPQSVVHGPGIRQRAGWIGGF